MTSGKTQVKESMWLPVQPDQNAMPVGIFPMLQCSMRVARMMMFLPLVLLKQIPQSMPPLTTD